MSGPYNSFGNGSAMRISPVGFAFDTLEDVLEKARIYTEITHNHPEGIKGAQATASAIFLARTGSTKQEIREYIHSTFDYDLSRTLDEIRPHYRFDVTCQGSVPEAIIAFLESDSFENAIRGSISLGGDSDTQACITGGIAQAFYKGVPNPIETKVLEILDTPLRSITLKFTQQYITQRA
jgi:ADP-ribosylglycohydrolase